MRGLTDRTIPGWQHALSLMGATALALALLCRMDWSSPFLMLLSVGTPLWALLALLAFAGAALCAGRNPRGALMAAAALVALVLLTLDMRGLIPVTSPATGQNLRIVEFNLFHKNERPEDAADWIAAQRPDVAVLLEASGKSRKVVARLRKQLPYLTSCHGDRHCSTLILSRIPPVERLGLAHGDADNRRALSAALVRFGPPWPDVTIVAVHLSRPLPLGRQAHEIDQLTEALAQRGDRRLVVAGDFNAPGWSIAMRRIARRLDLHMMPSPPSWPADRNFPPLLDIDHSLVGGAWGQAALQRGPYLGSDHRPFLLTLTAGHDGPRR